MRKALLPSAILLCAAGCAAVPPSGPTVLALPEPGRDLQRFQNEDLSCRSYASAQAGGGPAAQAGTQAAVGSAAVGTAVGAVAGGLIGSVAGQAGAGAAIGAGTGLVAGSAAGAGTARATTASLQAAYDTAYAQCMASAGNRIEGPSFGVVGFSPLGYGYYPYPFWGVGYPLWGPSVSLGFFGGFGYSRWRGYPGYWRPYPGAWRPYVGHPRGFVFGGRFGRHR